MRLIDANRFIEWLDVGHLRSPSEICYSEGDVKVMIDMQPTIEPYGKWIPCSERLPEYEGSYMTTTEYGAVRVNHFYARNKTWGYKSNRTIAWMPLPEPYREEKKDE